MKTITARQHALYILNAIESNNAYSNIAIKRYFKGKEIELLDRKLITELVYGVIENKIYLDFVISNLSKMKLKKISVPILNILRMGLYQIIFLDKIPTFAAVNESVNLTKKVEFRATGFVNGILRNYIRNKEKIKIPSKESDIIGHLSILYSHPRWLVEKWINEFGQASTIELLRANNETPHLTIRTNTLKISKCALKNELIKEGIEVSNGKYVDEALYISNVGNIEELNSFKKGYYQIQDESSMLVAHILDPKPNDFVIDVCSAPGGKTTHIAQLMNNQGYILARDIYEHKLELLQINAYRLGIHIIKTELFDAKQLDKELLEKADKVLVDAPCSGLGIIRRKPELKYHKQPDDIQQIMKLQLEILTNASKYVKKGGDIVYSTCTIEKTENIEVIQQFIEMNNDFEIIDVNNYLPLKLKGGQKYLQLYPHSHGTDGFFISKLRKKL